jgi:hypothetical protein
VQDAISQYENRGQKKEFAFTKLITCGLCGSGITADEKWKKLKNGTSCSYTYYGCSKYHDKKCPCGYIKEEDLIEQLAELMDKLDLDEIGMKEKIKHEIEKHRKFQSSLLGEKTKAIKTTDIDIRNYAKYVLREGSIPEKRELLSCLRSRIVLKNKILGVE